MRLAKPHFAAPVWVGTAIVATALIPLLVVGVIGYRTASNSLRRDTVTRLQNAANSTGDQLDRMLFERYGDVQAFARGKRAESMDPTAIHTLMDTLLRSYRPIYAQTAVADPQGRVVMARPAAVSALIGSNVSAQPWFRAALRKPVAVEQATSHAVTFSAAIRRNGRVVGVWENGVSWAVVQRILHDAVADAHAAGMHLFLLDAKGRTVASDAPAAHIDHGDLVQRSGEPGYSTYRGLGWTIVATQDRGLALAAATRLGSRMWVLGALSAALVLAAAFFAAAVVRRSAIAHERIERSMRESYKLQAVGQLAGGVAHDFNNLLTVIAGNAELARSVDDPAHSLDQIEHASGRARELVRQLMTFSRTHEPTVEVIDLQKEVASVLTMLPRVIESNVEIESDLAAEPAWVEADPVELERMLLNLAINARDAMPNGGVLTIATEKTDTAVRLMVSDTGIGMDEHTRERIFEPFFTTKPVGSGTGLGLATVYGTVAQAGGSIDVDSTPGMGTTFTIELPLAELAQPERSADARGASTGHGERVLLVEDEGLVRSFSESLLSRAGYRVTSAANGREALDVLEGSSFDLVISDVVMPRMTGLQLVTQMRARGIGTPVLLVSGYVQENDEIADKGVRILSKPFTPAELAAAMAELLG